nr:hypothetical protein [Microbacterium sp. Se5.02b]
MTTDETRAIVAERFGIADRWPVRSEAFVQWVLEDDFPLGRPPFETVGVQLVDDVEPYELMKLRLLNASHQAMSYLGILAGATMVHEVCSDPLFVRFLRGYMHHEAIPTLRPVPGIDLDDYCEQLLQRFGSTAVRDTLARQVVDGADRIQTFLLPVVREQLAAGGPIERATLVLAAWSVFLERAGDGGMPVPVTDRRFEGLRAAIVAEAVTPGAFLDHSPCSAPSERTTGSAARSSRRGRPSSRTGRARASPPWGDRPSRRGADQAEHPAARFPLHQVHIDDGQRRGVELLIAEAREDPFCGEGSEPVRILIDHGDRRGEDVGHREVAEPHEGQRVSPQRRRERHRTPRIRREDRRRGSARARRSATAVRAASRSDTCDRTSSASGSMPASRSPLRHPSSRFASVDRCTASPT